jgi:hypothetical protein
VGVPTGYDGNRRQEGCLDRGTRRVSVLTLTVEFGIRSQKVANRSLFSTRTSLIIARSVLEQYNTKHPGKLDRYIKLHVSATEWGAGVDTSAVSLHCPVPRGDVDHGGAFAVRYPMFSGDLGVALSLHCPVPRGDVDHDAALGVQYPMLSGDFGIETSALSLHCPIPRDDVDHGAAIADHLPHWWYSQ